MGGGGTGGGGVDGGGGGGGGGNWEHQDIIHKLFDHHTLITRDSEDTVNGIEACTYSNDPSTADWIKEHVSQMKGLLESESGSIRRWDSLFKIAFDLRDYHGIEVEETEKGVCVKQEVITAEGEIADCTKAVIQAHSDVLDKFIQFGKEEAQSSHEVPQECAELFV